MVKRSAQQALADIAVVSKAWTERLQQRQSSAWPELWALLDQVRDPEVPALSLWDLGVLCDIQKAADGKITVTITPTYSGCPAIDAMRQDIHTVLAAAGLCDTKIRLRLAPAWTTDWLSPQGREQLRAYGIAPPQHSACGKVIELTPEQGIDCPHCGSDNTRLVSEFGSTACKALFQCRDCQEPFDYFKHL